MVDATLNTRPRTIRLGGPGLRLERAAGGTITPGHLVKLGSANTFTVQTANDKRVSATFALENELIGNDIDDNYASGDLVQAETFTGGDRVLALLAANATAIVIGDVLVSAGDGTLKKGPGDYLDAAVIAVALEAVDNSAVSAVARIQVEIV